MKLGGLECSRPWSAGRSPLVAFKRPEARRKSAVELAPYPISHTHWRTSQYMGSLLVRPGMDGVLTWVVLFSVGVSGLCMLALVTMLLWRTLRRWKDA